MAQATRTDALSFLANRPLTPVATLLLQAVVTFVQWQERRRSRIALGHLDDHLLRDVGLEQDIALKEAQKPFWHT